MSDRDLILSKVARVLSDRQAAACNVDCGDMWKLHSDDFFADAYAVLDEIAATDLLEQLQHAVRFFDQINPSDVDRYRAAIAKATQ